MLNYEEFKKCQIVEAINKIITYLGDNKIKSLEGYKVNELENLLEQLKEELMA